MLCTHTYELSSSSLRQATQIFPVLLVLVCFLPPDILQNEDLYGFTDMHQFWKAVATVTLYFQGENISVKSHKNFWTGQPGITARLSHFVCKLNRCLCRQKPSVQIPTLIQLFFFLYLSDLKVQINKSQQIGRTGYVFRNKALVTVMLLSVLQRYLFWCITKLKCLNADILAVFIDASRKVTFKHKAALGQVTSISCSICPLEAKANVLFQKTLKQELNNFYFKWIHLLLQTSQIHSKR